MSVFSSGKCEQGRSPRNVSTAPEIVAGFIQHRQCQEYPGLSADDLRWTSFKHH